MLRLARIPLLRLLAPRPPVLPRFAPLAHPVPRPFFQHFAPRSPAPDPASDPRTALPKDASLSQRLRHLIRSYGWYALGVYTVLSFVDFGVAFAGINLIGAEHVARFTASVKDAVAGILHSAPPDEPGRGEIEAADAAGHGKEGLYAMLVLAYTVHKTLFFPVRVGLTAGLTPKLVSWLSMRGWAGGAGTRRAATEMRERIRSRSGSRDRH